MSARFLDKVVLVTGGGAGIGRATAASFANEGAKVVVTGRRQLPLVETVKEIENAGGTASYDTADVTKRDDVARMVKHVVDAYGRLDIAINNAGVLTATGPTADIDLQDWDHLFDVNVKGVLLSMQSEIPQMRSQGGGVIVNLSSVVGPYTRVPGLGAYGASKAAVSALTRVAAREYIRDGIRINAVSPASSDTTMSFRPGEDEAARAERMKHSVPLGRIGTLREVSGTILWLASDEAGFAVGQDLVIDGGASA
jgi:NAD(P)-dependent dehydrogenase (short-subunit alcohol dehydrogenase family)